MIMKWNDKYDEEIVMKNEERKWASERMKNGEWRNDENDNDNEEENDMKYLI